MIFIAEQKSINQFFYSKHFVSLLILKLFEDSLRDSPRSLWDSIYSVWWSCLCSWLFHFISQEYDRKKYQPNRLSSSELQMLASTKRQQNEELQDVGISHGLSASRMNCCNVNISISSDDHTAIWNSCFPPVGLNPQYFLWGLEYWIIFE